MPAVPLAAAVQHPNAAAVAAMCFELAHPTEVAVLVVVVAVRLETERGTMPTAGMVEMAHPIVAQRLVMPRLVV